LLAGGLEHADTHMNRKECDLKDERSAVCRRSIEPDFGAVSFFMRTFSLLLSIVL
jgi:hypothetical protein